MSERHPYGVGAHGPLQAPRLEVGSGLWLQAWEESDATMFYETVHANQAFLQATEPELAAISLEESVMRMKQLRANMATGLTVGYRLMLEQNGEADMVAGLNLFRRNGDRMGCGAFRVMNAGHRGIMHMATQALFRHGFEDLDLQTIWMAIRDDNEKSLRLMRNLHGRLVERPYEEIRQGEKMYEVRKPESGRFEVARP